MTGDEASGRKGHAWGGKLDYPNDLWDVALSYKEIHDAFAPALGFVRRTGVRMTNLGGVFMPRPGRLGIRQLFFELRPQHVTDTGGRTLDWMVIAARRSCSILSDSEGQALRASRRRVIGWLESRRR